MRPKNSALPEPITYATAESDLGQILVASSEKGVVSILIGGPGRTLLADLRRRFPDADISAGGARDQKLARAVARHIKKPKGELDLTLDLRGTPFQQKVWQALLAIPAGKTSSYKEVARKIGSPRAIRAVGSACGTNNLALAVPCHRVLHSDGSLSGGYFWGDARQAELLAREGVKTVGKTP
ncbi:MAG TPA: methylated-DNA--[protein]-cysteine S-methyltransferase [Rhizomicrobium sp.]|nr:methylated-DNA--[protein]-cysteine S-methyltransferase [Rhizomicrobium sp.]